MISSSLPLIATVIFSKYSCISLDNTCLTTGLTSVGTPVESVVVVVVASVDEGVVEVGAVAPVLAAPAGVGEEGSSFCFLGKAAN